METDNKNTLLRRDDARLSYSDEEIINEINSCEDKALKEFVSQNREDGVIMMWVKLNMRLVTDRQIDMVRDMYINNGWKRVEVSRHEERGIEDLLIRLYL